MKVRTIIPDRRYLAKLRLVLIMLALILFANGLLIGWLVSLNEDSGPRTLQTATTVSLIVNAVWLIPGFLLTGPYYKSLRYEIWEDEVIVHAGIITKSVKHVPFRTVTNLTVKRGILDRWLYDLGTVDIQTAGASGSTGAEESLAGLANYDEVYETVATELRRFRSSMDPTGAQPADERLSGVGDYLPLILEELRGIRRELEVDSDR